MTKEYCTEESSTRGNQRDSEVLFNLMTLQIKSRLSLRDLLRFSKRIPFRPNGL
jgi:hypothetical protein